jgi:hypothetical protein
MNHSERYQAGVENSALLRWAGASATARLLRTVGTWTRHSYLFRWLTAEPEPEVIVIDLRDTYTVGPFIAVLDWFITSLAPAYRHSRLRALGRRLATAFRSAPIRALSLGLLLPALAWLAFTAISYPISLRSLLPPLVLTGLAVAGTQVTHSLDELQENRLVALVLTAFAPPEPPTDQPVSQSTDGNSTTTSKTNDDP